MKFATLALFLGTISASQFEDELINELKIEVSKAGQAAIEKEATDVGRTMKKIEHSRPVRNLEASAKRFMHTKEVADIKTLDKKFLASPAGKKLVREWTDVGHVLKKHLHKTKNGLHMDNDAVDDLSDELDDVADEYKDLDGSKWDKAYERAFKRAFSTKQAGALHRRMKAFGGSNEGKMLKKEMRELKWAIKKNLKISDVDSSDDEDLEDDLESMIKIHVTKAGERAIAKEADDVEDTWKSIEHSRVVRNTGAALKRWGHSQEMKDLEALDRKFMSTPRGKKMAAEIEDVFRQLDKSVYHNKSGLMINNNELQTVDDELNDVEAEFKSFKKSKWQAAYDNAVKKVFTNKEAGAVDRRMKAFKASPQGKRLAKEMHELGQSMEKNIKVTDLPRNFSEEDDLFLF